MIPDLRPLLRSRAALVGAAVLAQLALVPVAVAGPLSAWLTGEEYLLEVAPVDPIDPFRGAYVALTYPGLPGGQELAGRREPGIDVVYVPLRPAGDVWVGTTPVAEPPESEPFLRCHDDHWRLRCGIDSWFLPQDEAYDVEQAVRDGRAVARVRIDARGNAALVAVDVSPSSRGTANRPAPPTYIRTRAAVPSPHSVPSRCREGAARSQPS